MPGPAAPAAPSTAAPAAPATPAPFAAPAAKPTAGMDAALQLLGALSAPTAPAPAPQAPPAVAAAPAPAQGAKPPEGQPPAQGAPPPPARPEDPRSHAFAIQAKKERALLDRERALKAQEQQLKAGLSQLDQMKADLDARLKSLGETETQRKTRRAEYARNPRLVLEDAGMSLEQLAAAFVNDGQPDPALVAQSVEERLKDVSTSVDEKLAKLAQAEKDREQRAAQAAREAAQREQEEAVAQVYADIAEVAKAEPEKYELVNFYGKDAQELAYRAIEAHYKESGEVLPYSTALAKVEAFLDERTEALAKTKRYGSRFKPREAAPAAPAALGAAPAAAPTLGNVGATPTAPVRKLVNEEERMAAAEAVLRGAKF